ncbi:serine/threonine protein kinase [Streptomyces piniterrae]|uniref:non-specific serine/threonine protein kinase n=1 Tax=Streptomyces piniterrae TaxID=2571125 RepID=A0A4U0NQJ1_9ACTN|nr:serine/threonine-protein kinase [Streptomyces piniterrae]TJZ56776.1 serine/threonine protein kinase [Streptomyces piniterrae]
MRGELLADRYRLATPLGSGGMGQVWRARDEVLGRAVAVKVVSRPADETTRERLVCEARAAARLSHPGIVAVFDVDETTDGRLFLVMELVEGRSLAQILREAGPLSPERVAAVGAQAAHALAAAHACGVIHRDIKPANLLIGHDGTVKVADFGIAVLAGGNSTALTTTGDVVGTASYTAPERAMGQRGTASCDLYALGCVLYEASAGRPPFRADNAVELLFQHVYRQPESLRRIRPDVPPSLERVVHALLAKAPAERPADATSTAALLSAPPDDDITSTWPTPAATGTSPPPGPTPQRWQLQTALGVLAAAVFAVTFAVAWADSSIEPTGQASRASSPAPDTSTSAKPAAPSPSSRAPSPSSTPAVVAASTTPAAAPTPPPPSRRVSPSALVAALTRRIRTQVSTMDPKLAREVQHRTAQLTGKLGEGKASIAADRVHELSRRLTEARSQGRWAGDARTEQLLRRLSRCLPTRH